MSDEPRKATAETDRHRAVHNVRHPRWHTVLNGRVYRPVMRVMHRWGWCYPQSTLVEPRTVWCHWCGMRGSKPRPLDEDAIAQKMRPVGRAATQQETR